jgi:hypothetical protein
MSNSKGYDKGTYSQGPAPMQGYQGTYSGQKPYSKSSSVQPKGKNFFFDKHGHRHHRNFVAFGFAGPYYDDYGYDSCWRLVQTYYGWQRVWVCGDNPYWGY